MQEGCIFFRENLYQFMKCKNFNNPELILLEYNAKEYSTLIDLFICFSTLPYY